jgi:hypothetical protein
LQPHHEKLACESMNGRVSLAAVLVFVILAGYLIINAPRSSSKPAPTFTFLSFTNTGAQIEALFRLDHAPRPAFGEMGYQTPNHAPRPAFAEGVYELRYQTPTGWALPSAPIISWRFFGWDGTASITAISVETTNLPARVVMDFCVQRKGIGGVYDRFLDGWGKLNGKPPVLRGRFVYVTNQTTVLRSTP